MLLSSSLLFLPAALPSAQAAPYSGPEPTPTNLTLFLHNSSVALPIAGGITSPTVLTSANDTAMPWHARGGVITGVHLLDSPRFYLFPRLAGDLTLNGTPTADIFVNETGSVGSGQWTFYLYALDTSGTAVLLGSGAQSYTGGYSTGGTGYVLHISLSAPLLRTLPAGWSLYASFSQTQGNNQDGYGFWYGDVGGTYYTASVSLPSSTYLAINQTYLIGPNGGVTTNLPTNVRTPIAELRANVSDPLGSYDYSNWTVNWEVEDSAGATIASGVMAALGPSVPPLYYGFNETYGASYNYSGRAAGSYTFCANATDNTNHNDLLFAGHWFGRAAQGCTTFFLGAAPIPVHVHVGDTTGTSLTGALVVAVPAGSSGPQVANGTTDSSGATTLLLPAGVSYGFQLYWERVWAGEVNTTVPASALSWWVNATALVFSPTFHFQDGQGRTVPFPLVFLRHPNGSDLPMQVANGLGNVPLVELPRGPYVLTVVFDDAMVLSGFTQWLTHGGATNVTVPSVYQLTVDARTANGGPLNGVFVQVIDTRTGATIASGYTSDGAFVTLVPAGTYYVNGTFETTYDLSALSQSLSQTVSVTNGDQTATLTFSKAYPPFYATTLFYAGLAIMLLLVMFLVTLIWGIRRGRARARGGKAEIASTSPSSSSPGSSTAPEETKSPVAASSEERPNGP